MKWVVLSFVTVENLGKRGLLTEGALGGPVSSDGDPDIMYGLCHVSQPVPPHWPSPAFLRVCRQLPARFLSRAFALDVPWISWLRPHLFALPGL